MNNSKEQTYKKGIFFSSDCFNLNNKCEKIVHNLKKKEVFPIYMAF